MQITDIEQLISCIDLTSLNENDNSSTISALCEQAFTPAGNVAAVCVSPNYVTNAWGQLMASPIKIATVANFPAGKKDFEEISDDIKRAVLDGADEIDIVIPYHFYHKNKGHKAREFMAKCRSLCGNRLRIKLILETGALTPEQIQQASKDAIDTGADFLKTSTGKIEIGATPEAARIMLKAIQQSGKFIGFKASGGIRTFEQACIYRDLVKEYLGEEALVPTRFRLGASSLLNELLEKWHAFHS